MQNPRDSGHALLHRLSLSVVVFVWFWAAVEIWERLDLSLIILPWNYSLVALAGLAVATFGSLQNYGAFYLKNGWERIREATTKANFQTSIIAFFVFAAYFATKDNETSRLFLGFYVVVCWPLLILSNVALPGVFKRVIGFHGSTRSSLIIGDIKSIHELSDWIDHQKHVGLSFEGAFCTSRSSVTDEYAPVKVLGFLQDLKNYLRENRTHQLVVIPDSNMESWVGDVAEIATQFGSRVMIYNPLSNLFYSRLVFMEESGRQFFTLLNEPLESPFNRMVKRSFDLVLSVPAALLLLPPSILITKTFQVFQAPGPLFFKQERVGLAGRKFIIWKFRSMTHAVEGERDESIQASQGDTRIFPFGRFIRHFSIDELPQLINVIKGEMSLVGPRPYLAKHDYLFEKNFKSYRVRQFVKPGVTGPAQCRGLRGEFTDPELIKQRIEMDFNYVGNWSIWLDIEIVFRTIGQVLFPPKSAY